MKHDQHKCSKNSNDKEGNL